MRVLEVHEIFHFDFFKCFLMTLGNDEDGLRWMEGDDGEDAAAGRRQVYLCTAGFFHTPTERATRR